MGPTKTGSSNRWSRIGWTSFYIFAVLGGLLVGGALISLVLQSVSGPSSLSNVAKPPSQRVFLAVIESAREQARGIDNEIAQKRFLRVRDTTICQQNPGGGFEEWVGVIDDVKATSQGAQLSVTIGDGVDLVTTSGGFVDLFSESSVISQGTEVFRELESLEEGDLVVIGGRFLPGQSNCIRENSFTEGGNLRAPDIVVRFTSLRPR